ncbi:hypothetical protein LOK49_LG15G00024 [Camellia lanceoleosa]|uniref:Uncharacterized protein n=1 Tax=Camellia lanceoleosa TaxID=1840588 RepID=A0ACC0F292_9ERIC|nr:hypothetical protein LOK49_LG15G00024 [Camellia lanceoleosa]
MCAKKVASLEIHEENLIDVEEQLRFLIHAEQAAKISYLLPLLKGSFSSWILNSLGILPGSIFPSVRCGLEMAILNAIAASEGSSLLNILHRETATQEELSERSSIVQICALIDSNGTPKDVVDIVTHLLEKVARRPDPIEDAMVIQEVRKKVGHQINLRADANRKRTYEETVLFGSSVMNCGLQYIEVNLEARVGFNTSVARGLIEEAKCVNADFLVVGHSRNRISREITRYCFEHAPEGCSMVSLRKCAVPQQNSDLNTLHIEEHCQMISKWSNENDRMDKSSVTKTKREKMFSPRTVLDLFYELPYCFGLPCGIIQAGSDLELKPLWSTSSSREKVDVSSSHNLLAIPVGIKQKSNVDVIVQKEGLSPLNFYIEDEFHRATRGGSGGVKSITNYAPG